MVVSMSKPQNVYQILAKCMYLRRDSALAPLATGDLSSTRSKNCVRFLVECHRNTLPIVTCKTVPSVCHVLTAWCWWQLHAHEDSAQMVKLESQMGCKEAEWQQLHQQLAGEVKHLQQQLLDARALQPWTPKAHEVQPCATIACTAEGVWAYANPESCTRHNVLPHRACGGLSLFCRFLGWGMFEQFCNTGCTSLGVPA